MFYNFRHIISQILATVMDPKDDPVTYEYQERTKFIRTPQNQHVIRLARPDIVSLLP